MYIEIHDWNNFEQKTLYFKLNNAFNMQKESDINHKIAGIYAIYNNEVCLYIGQSKNIASRLATHLKGKYKTATDIFIWDITELGFDDFYERNKLSQQSILDNSEKYFMTIFKPIENLLIDMDFEIIEDEKPTIYDFQEDSGFTSSFCIKIRKDIVLFSADSETYYEKIIGSKCLEDFYMPIEYIDKNSIKEIHNYIFREYRYINSVIAKIGGSK